MPPKRPTTLPWHAPLAIGVQRMAQRNAIIRRLPAVETLGWDDGFSGSRN